MARFSYNSFLGLMLACTVHSFAMSESEASSNMNLEDQQDSVNVESLEVDNSRTKDFISLFGVLGVFGVILYIMVSQIKKDNVKSIARLRQRKRDLQDKVNASFGKLEGVDLTNTMKAD